MTKVALIKAKYLELVNSFRGLVHGVSIMVGSMADIMLEKELNVLHFDPTSVSRDWLFCPE